MVEDVNITTMCLGQVWDVPVAAFSSAAHGALVGLEITDLGGRLTAPHIGLFVLMEVDGRKAFLSARVARDLAAQLIGLAEKLDAGATTAAVQ